jgi:uncharacterized protein
MTVLRGTACGTFYLLSGASSRLGAYSGRGARASDGLPETERLRTLVREVTDAWIPLSDGCQLSARLWLPDDAGAQRRVPAILEYVPYRKDDATAAEDASRHPYFAAHGFAGVRVDLRGTGDSQGVCLGEYLAQEHADALEVLAWLEAQPWCTGAVGMIG